MDDPLTLGAAPGSSRWSTWLDGRLDRLGVRGVLARDTLLAVVLALTTVAVLTWLLGLAVRAEDLDLDDGQVALFATLCAGQTLLLSVRRVRPLLCLALVAAAQVAIMAVVPADIAVRGVAPLVAAYTVGTLLPPRAAVSAASAALLVEVVGAVVVYGSTVDEPTGPVVNQALSAAVLLLGSVFVGTYVATRRRYVALVRERAEEVVRAQRATVRAAIGAERTRMARELHDLAAHHLSGMVVQAAAVERLVDRDPVAAKEGTAWIRAQGRRTLEDLRVLVGVLRDPDATGVDTTAPVPGLAVLDDLVATAREVGADVALERTGVPRELPPIADVALYRVAQEALSNARQHAPGAPVLLRLSYTDDHVTLAVENDPPGGRPSSRGSTADRPSSGGLGLVGMRERAQLIGASFDVGPTGGGGWRVLVVLPTGGRS